MKDCDAKLVLDDGKEFYGNFLNDDVLDAYGEVCFTTGMTGYQEAIFDPSYYGQLLVFTFPHIGNTGINIEDMESDIPSVRGLIIREKPTGASNYRSDIDFEEWIYNIGIPVIYGVDTREVTRYIRSKGCFSGKITKAHDRGVVDSRLITDEDLASFTSCSEIFHIENESPKYRIALIDFGVKKNILRCLLKRGCEIFIFPLNSKYEVIKALNPDGILLSPGPGNPSATVKHVGDTIRQLIGMPMFAICMGHQLLSIVLGINTKRMRNAHRGINHPVKDIRSGKILIATQNHGFVTNETSNPEIEITHRSLFDNTIAGFRVENKNILSVQFHPEASPGTKDTEFLFDEFIEIINSHKKESL